MRACADSNLKKTSLELGGKSPFIIFSDCDIDRAVRLVKFRSFCHRRICVLNNNLLIQPQGMSSVFFNKGENCIAAGRLFVEKSIHDEFVKRVLVEISKMVRYYSFFNYFSIHLLMRSFKIDRRWAIRWIVAPSTDLKTTRPIWTNWWNIATSE